MVDMASYWPIVIVLGLGTFLFRYSFILVMDKLDLSENVMRLLRFIPVAVLPALVAPALFLEKSGGEISYGGIEHTASGLVAILVAWKTRNIMATIASGMAVLWLLRAVL